MARHRWVLVLTLVGSTLVSVGLHVQPAFAACNTKDIEAYDPQLYNAEGNQGDVYRQGVTLSTSCDFNERLVGVWMEEGLGYWQELGWFIYWCDRTAGGSKCVNGFVLGYYNGAVRCNVSFAGPAYQTWPGYRIVQTTINLNPDYWNFFSDYGSGWVNRGHCLSNEDRGTVRGFTTEYQGNADMDTDVQVLRWKRPSDNAWVAWGGTACLINETTAWNFVSTSNTSYEVVSGGGRC